MDTINNFFQGLIPSNFDIARYLWLLLIGLGVTLVLGLLFRLICGKASDLNHCVSSAVAIICVYAISILIYSIGGSLKVILSPLPFVKLSGDALTIFPIFDASLPTICNEILELIVLAFVMNLLISWLPTGQKIYSWYFFRLLSIILSICLHYIINLFFNTIFPSGFTKIAPAVLLGLLLVSFLLGILKKIVGGALIIINPLLGILYTFFFSNLVGKQLSRAMLTTALLTALVYILNSLDIATICIASVTLLTYLPVIIIALFLWYVVGKLL